jgi:hypothetical protein
LNWLFLNTDTGLGSVHRLFVSLHLEKKNGNTSASRFSSQGKTIPEMLEKVA